MYCGYKKNRASSSHYFLTDLRQNCPLLGIFSNHCVWWLLEWKAGEVCLRSYFTCGCNSLRQFFLLLQPPLLLGCSFKCSDGAAFSWDLCPVDVAAKVHSCGGSIHPGAIRSWCREYGRMMCLLKHTYWGFDKCKLFCLCSALVSPYLEKGPLLGSLVQETWPQ